MGNGFAKRRWRVRGSAQAPGVLPNFLIVGAPKCGTTSLFKYLSDHPQAYLPYEKELNYFDVEFHRGIGWYTKRFAAGAGCRAIGEATPHYLLQECAQIRLAETVPDARLIVMLRNPVDRAYSQYWDARRRWGERRTFERAIDQELVVGGQPLSAELPGPIGLLAAGHYHEQLERLCRRFPRERVHVIIFEDLRERPVETFQAVCRFLDIDEQTVPERVGSVENANLQYHPKWLWRIIVGLRIGLVLPTWAGHRLFLAMTRETEPYPPLQHFMRARLTEYFAPENRALAQWLGRDLSHWMPGGEGVSELRPAGDRSAPAPPRSAAR
jgi:hypothetical protein